MKRWHRWLRQPYPLMALLGLPLLVWTLGGPHTVEVVVSQKAWWREIEIERRTLVVDSDWCERLPAGVELLERQWREDPSGEHPAADHCRYRGLQWRKRRSAVADGTEAPGERASPYWPAPDLAGAPEPERTGKRQAVQELHLRSARDDTWTCRLSLSVWQSFRTGQALTVQVDRWGVADCSTLRGR